MHPGLIRIFRSVGLLLALWPGAMRADDLADKGREIFEKNQHAVITVAVVLKMKMSLSGAVGAEDSESKQELTGTVIDPSGLTVLSLSSCEPEAMMQAMMDGMSDEDVKVKMDSELNDVKLLLADGTELPAEIVLRDKDLDLAFVRPKTKPGEALAVVDLGRAGTARVLDQVITLNRLGQVAGRAYAASVERISAVVQKPRRFYIPGSDVTTATLGAPTFTLDGNLLGIVVMRSLKQKSGGMGMFNFRPDGMMPIILPVAEILKAAKQVPDRKDESGKKDEPKESPPAKIPAEKKSESN